MIARNPWPDRRGEYVIAEPVTWCGEGAPPA